MGWYFATCSMWGVFWKGFLQGVCTEVDGEKFFRKVSELLNAVSRDIYIYIYFFTLNLQQRMRIGLEESYTKRM